MSGIKSNNYIDKEDKKYSSLYKKGYGQGPIDIIVKELKNINLDLKNLDVLDCGCGHSPILSIYDIKRYVGVDISSYQINKLKNKNPKIEYHQLSIDNLNIFSNKEFDYVWCSDVLEHVEENRIYDTLFEINRVSKQSILSVSTRESLILSDDKENLHLTVKDIEWWDTIMEYIFEVTHKIELFRNNVSLNSYLYITKNK